MRTVGIDAGATLCKLALSSERLQTELFPSTELEAVRARIERWGPEYIVATGGGARKLGGEIAGVQVQWVPEVDAWARGAPLLARREGVELPERYLLVSLGTGTSVVEVRGDDAVRVGGTALGGGTLLGLGQLLLGIGSFREVTELAARGNRQQVDLLVGDIYPDGGAPLAPEVTAANFGKLASTRREDLAQALMGLVGENIGLICGGLAQTHGLDTVVYGGSPLTDNPLLQQTLSLVTRAFGGTVHLPASAAFCGAVGAVLSAES